MKTSLFFIGLVIALLGLTAWGSIGESPAPERPCSSPSINPSLPPHWADPFSQNINYPSDQGSLYLVRGKYKRSMPQEKLNNAQTLADFIPDYPVNWISHYKGVKIVTDYKGERQQAHGNDEMLTTEQRALLKQVKLNTQVEIMVDYHTENAVSHKLEARQMETSFTVIPDHSALFPGGEEALITYLQNNSLEEVRKWKRQKMLNLALVSFTIDEMGRPILVTLEESCGEPALDQLMIDLIQNMPSWEPAQNAAGKNVEQHFEFVLGPPGC